MRKLLSLFLALAMILTAAAAFAEDADWGRDDYAAHAVYLTELAGDYTGKTVILHSNDVHGQLDGYAYIAGLRDYLVTLGAEVILADVGDFSQGAVYVNSSEGASAIEMMNAVGYNVATLGNHEFDFGYGKLMDNLSKADFPVICASVTLDETGSEILPVSTVLTTEGGLKIGFVGVETPETATKVNPPMIKGLTFATFDKLYETTQKAVDEIRPDCDLVFGLFHLGVDLESKTNGYRSVDVLGKTTGIDFVLDGHSHFEMTSGQNGEPVQSAGTKFSAVGMVVIDNESKGIESAGLIRTFLGSKLYSFNYVSETVLAKAKEIMDKVDEEYSAVFATSETVLDGERATNRSGETNMGDLITDAMVWSVVKEGGIEQVEPNAVVGVTNGGGIRASIAEGEVTKKDINTVLPFGNTVAVVYVTGAELLEALEASTYCTPELLGGYPQTSGIEWTLDTTKEFAQGDLYILDGKDTSYYAPASINRVTITAVNGEPFDENATYAVVTNNFCAVGGDTYNVFARSSSSFDTSIPMDEAVMAYVSEALGGKITAEAYGAPRGSAVQIK